MSPKTACALGTPLRHRLRGLGTADSAWRLLEIPVDVEDEVDGAGRLIALDG